MPSNTSVEIVASDVTQIVESVFATMLSLEVNACRTPWFPSADRMTTAIHLTGDWNCTVLLECERPLACRFASRFLSRDVALTVDDLVRDVLGELANMIGGNLKGILTSGARLSMPLVIDGSDFSLRVCGGKVRERLLFECADGAFAITVLTT